MPRVQKPLLIALVTLSTGTTSACHLLKWVAGVEDVSPSPTMTATDSMVQRACNGSDLYYDAGYCELARRTRAAQSTSGSTAWSPADSVLGHNMASDLFTLEEAQLSYYRVNGVFSIDINRLRPVLPRGLLLGANPDVLLRISYMSDYGSQGVAMSLQYLGHRVECNIRVIAGAQRYQAECGLVGLPSSSAAAPTPPRQVPRDVVWAPTDASRFVGGSTSIEGTISQTSIAPDSSLILYLGPPPPNWVFAAIIQHPPASLVRNSALLGRSLRVTGQVALLQGRPAIQISSRTAELLADSVVALRRR